MSTRPQGTKDLLEEEERRSTKRLQVLSKEDIINQKIPTHELWYLLVKGEAVGPYLQNDLYEFVVENPQLSEELRVSCLKSPKWITLKSFLASLTKEDTTLPQIPSVHSDRKYKVLKNGQKHGPMSFEKVQEMLAEKKLSLLDLVYQEHLRKWVKLQSLEEFSGVQKKTKGPPLRPANETLITSIKEVKESMVLKNQESEDALIELVQLGQKEKKWNQKAEVIELPTPEKSPQKESVQVKRSNKVLFLITCLLMVLIGTAIGFWREINTQGPTPQVEKVVTKTLKKTSQVKTPRSNEEGLRRPSKVPNVDN